MTRLFACLALTCALAVTSAAHAQVFQTEARAAVIIDHNTRQVLLSKDATVAMPPASMSKLMTINMLFEALADGRVTLDTEFPVTPHAASYTGSTMFLDPRDRVRVEDLIRGIIVLSGNDACAVVAEALSPDGTEAGFARMMTQRAQELGMAQSNFVNASGWPAVGHVMSMQDLALLAERLITEFPQFYPYFAETEFKFDGRAPANTRNRNPLLGLGIGADGLKTGHTQEAGYGLVGSAVQGSRRVTFVITGLPSEAARAREAERVATWAFRQFAERQVLEAGEVVMQAEVFMGRQDSVPLVVADPVSLLVPAVGGDQIEAEILFDGPLPAPITKGAPLGRMVLRLGDMAPVEVPVFAGESVARAGVLGRISHAGGALMGRVLGDG